MKLSLSPASAVRGLSAAAPLWVSGLALIIVLVTSRLFFGTHQSDARMPIHLLLGTLMPLCVLAISVGRGADRARTAAKSWLGVCCVALSLPLLVRYSSVLALGLGLSQWLATLLLVRLPSLSLSRKRVRMLPGDRAALSGVTLYAALVCWTVLVQLFRGDREIFRQFGFVEPFQFRVWAFANSSAAPVFCAAFVLVLAFLYHRTPLKAGPIGSVVRNISWIGDGLALAIFAVLSFRSDLWAGQYFGEAYWHWSYFVGPAEDIRQGGWLLWNVPSWYGFGNILLIAALPTASCWQSMYVLNSSALLLSAVVLYNVLKALRPDGVGWFFSFAATTACVFLLPGWAYDVTGPQIWPSAAAFRFVWVYVILAILWWGLRFRMEGARAVLLLGCLAWLAGVVWSLESAVYVTAVWLPSFALLVWHYAGQSAITARGRLLARLLAWLFPLFLLGATGAGLLSFYWLALGHAPELSSYYEVALSFGAMFSNQFYTGSVGLWVLLLVFCAASTAVVSLLRSYSPWPFALALAAWASLWATGSYPVLKGDASMLLSAAPLFVTAWAVLLHLLNQQPTHSPAASLPHTAFAAVLIALLSLAFGNIAQLASAAARVRIGYAGLASAMPALDEGRLNILRAAGVPSSEGLIVLDEPGILDSPLRSTGTTRLAGVPWLPVRSWERMVFFDRLVVPVSRMRQYVSRSTARARTQGYILVKRKTRTSPVWAWLFEGLEDSHVESIAYETADYLLLRYGPKPGA